MFYVALKIIHHFCACVVIGYLIYDVFIFSAFRKSRSDADFTALKREILKPSALILGVSFAALILSGALLASFYLGGDLGFFQNTMQKLLWLKIAVIALLFVLTPISFYFLLRLKKPDPFRRFYHHIALVICVVAFLIANLFFVIP